MESGRESNNWVILVQWIHYTWYSYKKYVFDLMSPVRTLVILRRVRVLSINSKKINKNKTNNWTPAVFFMCNDIFCIRTRLQFHHWLFKSYPSQKMATLVVLTTIYNHLRSHNLRQKWHHYRYLKTMIVCLCTAVRFKNNVSCNH